MRAAIAVLLLVSAMLSAKPRNAILSPTTLSFPTQPVGTTGTAQRVTLSNTGDGPLSISGISLTGAIPGDFGLSSNCGSSLGGGLSCYIDVTFRPTASGTRTATLSISDNAPGSRQTISLSGQATVVAPQPHKATIAWTPSITPNVFSYNVYRCNGSSCTPTIMIGSTSSTTFTDANVTAGVAYCYFITAVDVNGESGPSNMVTAVIGTP